ncbi:MAG: NTP transferase domain-containing protein [Anaerolineaceae bacterium]|nr:NTP transferase domain-containing protein [Anaerolineaceae bacterium]
MAIIPARGGSKRLPRKNVLPFLGRPIILWTVEAARKSELFERVIVSTDDDEIAACVEPTGCEVHRRPPGLGADDVRVVDVLKNLLGTMAQQFDRLCCLYPTAPLRTAEDIRAAHDLMVAREVDFCCGVTEFDESPFFAFDIDQEARIRRRWPDLAVLPPREKPKVVVDNGSLYWARVEAFLRLGELEGRSMAGYLMPRRRSVDIDTEFDFRLAEFMAGQVEKA